MKVASRTGAHDVPPQIDPLTSFEWLRVPPEPGQKAIVNLI
jgi:hypothetical protein